VDSQNLESKLVPIDEPAAASTMGSVRLLADDDEAYYSTGEAWAADRADHR
jgi:hypothetical protein